MFQRILVATDGSPLSDKAVGHAIDLAALSGATLIALQVVPRYPLSNFEGYAAMDVDEVSRAERQWNERAQALLEAVRQQAEASAVKVQTAVASSDRVADSILAAAAKHSADLIVMGSHARTGIERLLLGSETQHVLTHTRLPVLVLR